MLCSISRTRRGPKWSLSARSATVNSTFEEAYSSTACSCKDRDYDAYIVLKDPGEGYVRYGLAFKDRKK